MYAIQFLGKYFLAKSGITHPNSGRFHQELKYYKTKVGAEKALAKLVEQGIVCSETSKVFQF